MRCHKPPLPRCRAAQDIVIELSTLALAPAHRIICQIIDVPYHRTKPSVPRRSTPLSPTRSGRCDCLDDVAKETRCGVEIELPSDESRLSCILNPPVLLLSSSMVVSIFILYACCSAGPARSFL